MRACVCLVVRASADTQRSDWVGCAFTFIFLALWCGWGKNGFSRIGEFFHTDKISPVLRARCIEPVEGSPTKEARWVEPRLRVFDVYGMLAIVLRSCALTPSYIGVPGGIPTASTTKTKLFTVPSHATRIGTMTMHLGPAWTSRHCCSLSLGHGRTSQNDVVVSQALGRLRRYKAVFTAHLPRKTSLDGSYFIWDEHEDHQVWQTTL